MTLCWILTPTHKHHIIYRQYPSHKCLPEKSCLGCLRILIMSWLFKVPIVTVAWFNFHHAHSNNKKWPKKIKLPQIEFFLEKQLTKVSSTYYPISFWKIFKKFLEPIQSYENVPFSGPNLPICPKQMFFYTNHYCYFHLPIGPFNCAKFKKKFLQRIQSYKDAPYLGPK